MSFQVLIMENNLERLGIGGHETVAVTRNQLHLTVGGLSREPCIDTGSNLEDDPWDDPERQDSPPNLLMERHLREMMIIHGQAENQQNSPDAEEHDNDDQRDVVGF